MIEVAGRDPSGSNSREWLMGVVTEARDIRKLSRKLFAHLPQSVRLWVNQCDSSQRMKSLLVTSDFSKMLNFFVMNGNAKMLCTILYPHSPLEDWVSSWYPFGVFIFLAGNGGDPKKALWRVSLQFQSAIIVMRRGIWKMGRYYCERIYPYI